MPKMKPKKSSAEVRYHTVTSTALNSSYQLSRASAGVCIKRTDRRQMDGREHLFITSLLFRDCASFHEYCKTDALASTDPFTAKQLERAFDDLYPRPTE